MEEEFRWVVGFEGIYKVSNLGRVYSVERMDANNHKAGGVFLTHRLNFGYPIVTMRKDNRNIDRRVHRLVAEAFIPNPENKPEVDHIDGNRANCVLSNLRWVTKSENMNNPVTYCKMSDNGKKNANYGTKSPFSRKVAQYSLDGKLIQIFDSAGRAAAATGITYSAIRKCAYGKGRTCGGYRWEYLTEAKITPKWGKKKGHGCIPIQQLTLQGELVAEYEGIEIAAQKTGYSAENISKASSYGLKTYKGFLWRRKN